MSSNGGALSFLNQGTSPASNENYSQTSSQLPSWYTDYTSQILNKAAQFANQPFQLNPNPQLATQSDLTDKAYSDVTPMLGSAQGNTAAATNLIQSGANNNNPLAAANPYLANGTNATYNTVGNYMNPYNQNVTDAIARAGNTNFQNNVMPQLESSIIGAGNITGSSTEGANLIENAAKQNEENITNAQAGALQSGYTGSLNAAATDASHNLTAAGTAGNLNLGQTQNQGALASALGSIGTQGNANALNDISAENTLGEQNQGYNQANLNVLNNQWQQQMQYPITGMQIMQGALQGIQVPTGSTSYNYGTSMPSTTGASPLNAALGALNTPGVTGSPTTNFTLPAFTSTPGAPGYNG